MTKEGDASFEFLDDEVFTSDSDSVYSFDAPSFSSFSSPGDSIFGSASISDRGNYFDILYSRNVWHGDSLANHQKFVKLKASKLVVPINDLLPKSLCFHFCQTFLLPKFPTIR